MHENSLVLAAKFLASECITKVAKRTWIKKETISIILVLGLEHKYYFQIILHVSSTKPTPLVPTATCAAGASVDVYQARFLSRRLIAKSSRRGWLAQAT
ncbi:uncharacterized protein [Aegilops tauschii subsp. strangulata]|uniref:uncharacterized protein isoform X1 n=1 Tax=Aegilops tauschii subsp. strangulata TaxID=200361 RepID=UPI003CC8A6F8